MDDAEIAGTVSHDGIRPLSETSVIRFTPILLTALQVGAFLGGISERQIRSWRSSGWQGFPRPVSKLGRITRWRRIDIEKWANSLPNQMA